MGFDVTTFVESRVKKAILILLTVVAWYAFVLLQYKERLEREKFLQDLQKRIINCPVNPDTFCISIRLIVFKDFVVFKVKKSMASPCRYWQRKAAILFERRMSSYCQPQALVNKLNRNSGTEITWFLRDATQTEVIYSARIIDKFRYIEIQPKTTDLSTKLEGITLKTCVLSKLRPSPPVMTFELAFRYV